MHPRPISYQFSAVFGQSGQNSRLVPDPFGVGAPRLGNPRSATDETISSDVG